jgi:hypothetical protein
LLELGERLTEFRTRLRQAALTANEQETFSSSEDLHADLGKLAARIHKGYFTSLPKVDSGFSYNETPAPARKKGSRRPLLTQSEKLAIVHAVVVNLKKVKDVAKEYRVTVSTVGVLVHKANRKPKFIEELFAKQDLFEVKRVLVEEVVNDMVDKNVFIDSCQAIIAKIKGPAHQEH